MAFRVWMTAGARKRGIETADGRTVGERLSLASEARQLFIVTMMGLIRGCRRSVPLTSRTSASCEVQNFGALELLSLIQLSTLGWMDPWLFFIDM